MTSAPANSPQMVTDVATAPIYVSVLDPKRCVIVNPGELCAELEIMGFTPGPLEEMRRTFATLRSGSGLAEFCNALICLGIPFAEGPAALLCQLRRQGFSIDNFWKIVWNGPNAWRLTAG